MACELSVKERQALIEEGCELSIRHQCALLGLNRTTRYYKPTPPRAMELLVKQVIDHIYTRKPFYGHRRIREDLVQIYGLPIDRKTTLAYMRDMGLCPLYSKPNLSKGDLAHRVYPYLLNGLAITRPDQVWSTDITYIPLLGGFMYLTVVIDWFSRYILSWALSNTLEQEFVLEACNGALTRGKPQIMNSDQGSHYTSAKYTELFTNAHVAISMDHRGRCFDNIFVERFWRSVKYELIYINDFTTPRELRAALMEYIKFYNDERFHQNLGYRTPAQVYYGGPK